MNETSIMTMFCPPCIEKIKHEQERIHLWLNSCEDLKNLPLYSSVDIRDAGFKIAVVDTNIFPAGFNNLCEHGLEDSVHLMRTAIDRRVTNCRDILIVAEEHTRNTWYLENIRILEQIIERAGYRARIATFLAPQPDFCEGEKAIEMKTATNETVKIYCFQTILNAIESKKENFDFILLNNDLTTGIPDVLKNSTIPIYPSIQAGWHSRLKSKHFSYAQKLLDEFGAIVGMDPWFFSCLYKVAEPIDINNDSDRQRLKEIAEDLFEDIKDKYREHNISAKSYIVIKPDSGTYGMGVIPIEDPADILTLNRRLRNQLHTVKGSRVVDRYLLQEGVPTIYQVDEQVSEAVLYQIENNLVGGFYRFNTEKSDRENLNSKGMGFKKMCPHLKKYGNDEIHPDLNIFDIYRLLARIAGIAAHREIIQLESQNK